MSPRAIFGLFLLQADELFPRSTSPVSRPRIDANTRRTGFSLLKNQADAEQKFKGFFLLSLFPISRAISAFDSSQK